MSADEPVFDPERILGTLERHGVEYVIIGGFGSQVHGVTRQTIDLDLVPSTTARNDERLAAALRDLNARLRVAGMPDDEARQLPIVIDAATLRAFGSTTWTTEAGPLDVLHDLPTAGGRRTCDELVRRSDDYSLSGIVVSVASPMTSSKARLTPTAQRIATLCPNSSSSADNEISSEPEPLLPRLLPFRYCKHCSSALTRTNAPNAPDG